MENITADNIRDLAAFLCWKRERYKSEHHGDDCGEKIAKLDKAIDLLDNI